MPEPAPSVATLADSLSGTFPACDDAPLARALLRALANGQAVDEPALTAAARTTADQWLSQHEGAAVLSVPDAFGLGRLATRCFA